MNAENTQAEQPQSTPETAEDRARSALERIAEDARERPEDYLSQMELPEGGE